VRFRYLRDLHESGVDPDIVPAAVEAPEAIVSGESLEYGLACMRRVVPYEDRQGGVERCSEGNRRNGASAWSKSELRGNVVQVGKVREGQNVVGMKFRPGRVVLQLKKGISPPSAATGWIWRVAARARPRIRYGLGVHRRCVSGDDHSDDRAQHSNLR